MVVVFILAALNYKRIYRYFTSAGETENSVEVKLLLNQDPTLTELIDELAKARIYSDAAKLRGYVTDNNIDSTKLAGGKYIIAPGTEIDDLIHGFVKDENGNGNAEVKVNVVFNRCRDIYDIGANISQCIASDSAEIVDCILSDETMERYQFSEEQIPALFIPGSYEMYYDTDAKEFVAEMAIIFKSFWNEERLSKMKNLGFKTPSQVVTLASIVYSEQGRVSDEWPIIASLYLNRLQKGMKLQSDPTFKFCWGRDLDGVQRLLAKHRRVDCPYNTYIYEGLPPGPIFITPANVIDAVLSPASSDFIFMCAKPDNSGRHNFTSSGAQHERNARTYQQWLSTVLSE